MLNDHVSAQLFSLGGTRMEDVCSWGFSSTIMSRTLQITGNGLELGNLTHLKSFQAASSHKNRTTKDNVIPNLLNAGGVDLNSEMFVSLDIVLYGGQFADRIVTSDEIMAIKGTLREDLNDCNIMVTRYPAKLDNYN